MPFKDNTFLFLYLLNCIAQGPRDGHTRTDGLYHHGIGLVIGINSEGVHLPLMF